MLSGYVYQVDIVFLQTHQHTLQSLRCVCQGLLHNALERFMVGDHVYSSTIAVLVELLDAPHYGQHLLLKLGVSCLSVCERSADESKRLSVL